MKTTDKIKSFFKSFLLRWKTEEILIKTCNRATPLHRKVSIGISCLFIVIALIVCLFSFPSSAEEGIISRDVPTDLTGYTVSVPYGWSASAGYGSFSIEGTFDFGVDGGDIDTLFIGFSGGGFPLADNVSFWFQGNSDYLNNNSVGFTLNISGGSSTSDTLLIQWFVDNDAVFVNNNPDPNPLVTFNKGLYKVSSTWYNSDISTQLDGMEFYSLSEGDLFTALTVQNGELIFDDENGDMHVMARNTTTGAKWIDNSGQFVYFLNDESIPQSLAEQIPTLLEYISDVSLTEFQRMQDSWYYGVQDGFTEGYNQASRDTEGTFLGNIFGGVFDALDKFQMFGQFSFLDFIKSIIGILALIWFLKLLAGG